MLRAAVQGGRLGNADLSAQQQQLGAHGARPEAEEARVHGRQAPQLALRHPQLAHQRHLRDAGASPSCQCMALLPLLEEIDACREGNSRWSQVQRDLSLRRCEKYFMTYFREGASLLRQVKAMKARHLFMPAGV